MGIPQKTKKALIGTGDKSAFSFRTKNKNVFTAKKGLNRDIIIELSNTFSA